MVLQHLLSKYQLVTGTMRERHHKALHKKKAFTKKNSSLIFLTVRKKKGKKNEKEK
jgi:hypothetical protein